MIFIEREQCRKKILCSRVQFSRFCEVLYTLPVHERKADFELHLWSEEKKQTKCSYILLIPFQNCNTNIVKLICIPCKCTVYQVFCYLLQLSLFIYPYLAQEVFWSRSMFTPIEVLGVATFVSRNQRVSLQPFANMARLFRVQISVRVVYNLFTLVSMDVVDNFLQVYKSTGW